MMNGLSNCRPVDERANTVGCGPARDTLAQLALELGGRVEQCRILAERILSSAAGLERTEPEMDAEVTNIRDELARAVYRINRLHSVLEDLLNEVSG